MESTVYNQKGKESGKLALPESVFGLPWNGDLVHQVVTSIGMSQRTPVAHTKMRGDVRGGGKKPWQQKGTGRARHGSTRSPIWVGGGVAHGPRNDKNFFRKINKKMKIAALFTILSRKNKEGEILFVDTLNMSEPKTRVAVETLVNFSKIKGFEGILSKRNNSAYIVGDETDKNLSKSFSNINNVKLDNVRNINPVDVLSYKYLVIAGPANSLAFLESKIDRKIKAKANFKAPVEVPKVAKVKKVSKAKPVKKTATKKAKVVAK